MIPASGYLNYADIARYNLIKRYLIKTEFNKKPKYNVGTQVRMNLGPEAFQKGYESRCTLEIFRITHIYCARKPRVYTLVDLDGEVMDGISCEKELYAVKKILPALFSKSMKFCKLKVSVGERSISCM